MHDGEGLSALTARVCGSSSPAVPGEMRHSSASTRVLVWSRRGASSIQRCGGRGGANSLSDEEVSRSARDQEWARTLTWLARLRADGTTKTIYKPIEPSNVLTALLENQNMDDETRRQWALRLEAMPGVKSIRPAIASPRTLRAPLARRAAARWQWVQRARHRCNEFKQHVVEQSALLLEAPGTAPTRLAPKEPHGTVLRKVRFHECSLRDPFIFMDPLVN